MFMSALLSSSGQGPRSGPKGPRTKDQSPGPGLTLNLVCHPPPMTWDFRGIFKEDFEGDLEGDLEVDLERDLEGRLEGDSKGDFRGDSKQDME